MRTTKGKRNNRRSHHGASIPTHTTQDGVTRLRHHASRITGTYRSRSVLSMERHDARVQKKEEMKRTEGSDEGEKRTVEQASVGS